MLYLFKHFQANLLCSQLDLQILLENVSSNAVYPHPTVTHLQREVDTLLTDAVLSPTEQQALTKLCQWKFSGIKPHAVVQSINLFTNEKINASPLIESSKEKEKTYQHVCAGGTFDR